MPRGQETRAGAGSDPLTVNARVLEALPNAMYRVELETGDRRRATVHASGDAHLLRILPGEAVVVELAPYDQARGRIVKKRES